MYVFLLKRMPYLACASFLCAWWSLAFFLGTADSLPVVETPRKAKEHSLSLFAIEREELRKALAGDKRVIRKLLAEWDADIRLMQQKFGKTARWLSEESFLRALYLSKISSKQPVQQGVNTYLPQTYAAATILLSLVPPEQISAIPEGLLLENHLFPNSLFDNFPLIGNRFNAEKIYLRAPSKAFIAPYSNPAVIQSLSAQGVKLISTNTSESVEEIIENILLIGRSVEQEESAELLALFLDASMAAIENKLALETPDLKNENVLFVNHTLEFSIPSPHSLTGSLLAKLGASPKLQLNDLKRHRFTIPVDLSEILSMDPDRLIIAAASPKDLQKRLYGDARLAQLKSVKNKKIFSVEYQLQQNPSQAIVLAYYDLAETLWSSS